MKKRTFFSRSPIFLLGFILLFMFSCQKDDSPSNDNPNGDPTNSTGRFSDHLTCTITGVPSEVNLSSFYTKYLNCSGIPVIATDGVPDEAMYIADQTMEFMLTGLGTVRDRLISTGNYAILYEEGMSIGDLPEGFGGNPDASGVYEWNNIFRALASDIPSLMCNPDVGFGHTLVHEFAHMMHMSAINTINTSFQNQLESAYSDAIANGLWDNTYARSAANEYLAEGVTIWYGVNWIGPEGGDGFRNEIGSRNELQQYDPTLFNLINGQFNSLTEMPGCREPVNDDASANCPGTVTDIDGNVYEVVNIGRRCWMKENLKTTRYRDGSPILNLTDESDWSNTTTGAYVNYENDTSNDATFGKLYNWYAFNNSGLCPEGWRIPTIQDMINMVYQSGGDHEARNLKSIDYWDPPNPDHTNSSGFTGLPAGVRGGNGDYYGMFHQATFGSSTVGNESSEKYYTKGLHRDHLVVFQDQMDKNSGLSCRCIKDD